MSMLSAQVNELCELATRYDELQVGAVKAIKMPSDMGSVLRDAADTIWELRGSVHRERAEADTLRASNEVIAEDHAALCEQNANLRELVKEMWSVMWACAEERCTHRENGCYRVSGNGTTPKGHGECWFKQRMRELWVE